MSLKGVHLGHMGLPKAMIVEKAEYVGVMYRCPAIAYIIEHPDGRILWETGISPLATQEWPEEWQQIADLSAVHPEVCLESRLKQFGLGPEDFRYVVMGHLHTDHAGGLRLFQDAAAEIIVHEDELRHVEAMATDAENFYNRADFAFLDGRKPTTLSGDTIELAAGVTLMTFPGHTPGLMGMMIDLEHTGPVLLTSDALYTHDNYGPPDVGAPRESPIVWDSEKWATSVQKVRRVATEREAFIFPGHDEDGIKQFRDRKEVQAIKFWPDFEYE